MKAWGVAFMVAGAACVVVGIGGGLVGFAFLGTFGGALFSLGIILVVAGNIVAAIDRNGAAMLAELKGSRDDHRKGFESNWQMFDRIRENTGGTPSPALTPPTPPSPPPPSSSRWKTIDDEERRLSQGG